MLFGSDPGTFLFEIAHPDDSLFAVTLIVTWDMAVKIWRYYTWWEISNFNQFSKTVMFRHGFRTCSETDQSATLHKDYNFIKSNFVKSIKASSAVIKSYMKSE